MFQMWKYTVGHRQLLLRSTKSDDAPTRIDVFFKGVSEFQLPTSLYGLSISEASAQEIESVNFCSEPDSRERNSKVFIVKSRKFSGYVVASLLLLHEDQGEYHDPSFFAKKHFI